MENLYLVWWARWWVMDVSRGHCVVCLTVAVLTPECLHATRAVRRADGTAVATEHVVSWTQHSNWLSANDSFGDERFLG